MLQQKNIVEEPTVTFSTHIYSGSFQEYDWQNNMEAQFKMDVDAGLSQQHKHLPSKYFYDKKGDELFMQIMAMPEYYLTRAEMEIFEKQSTQMITALGIEKNTYFELIELGAGTGEKTEKLLAELLEQGYQFDYLPIDISLNVLEHLQRTFKSSLPSLKIKPQHGDYFQILNQLKHSHHPKIVLFLGSNIGNVTDEQAAQFIYDLGENLSSGDKLLIGVDRIKSADIVLPAYNDKQGITRAFNLNLLRRINQELGGNFKLDEFIHVPQYEEDEGIAKSYLQSRIDQSVTISQIGKTYYFKKGENIQMEISRKYNTEIINRILKDTDFTIVNQLTDRQQYFSDFILERH